MKFGVIPAKAGIIWETPAFAGVTDMSEDSLQAGITGAPRSGCQ
jgi:hypothetical protein